MMIPKATCELPADQCHSSLRCCKAEPMDANQLMPATTTRRSTLPMIGPKSSTNMYSTSGRYINRHTAFSSRCFPSTCTNTDVSTVNTPLPRYREYGCIRNASNVFRSRNAATLTATRIAMMEYANGATCKRASMNSNYRSKLYEKCRFNVLVVQK